MARDTILHLSLLVSKFHTFPNFLPLPQCYQHSNHCNGLKELIIFFHVLATHRTTHLHKKMAEESALSFSSLVVGSYPIRLQAITDKTLHQIESQGVSSSWAGRRETLKVCS